LPERAGWEIIQVYKDHGISGAKGRDGRPAFDALHKDSASSTWLWPGASIGLAAAFRTLRALHERLQSAGDYRERKKVMREINAAHNELVRLQAAATRSGRRRRSCGCSTGSGCDRRGASCLHTGHWDFDPDPGGNPTPRRTPAVRHRLAHWVCSADAESGDRE
jgi:hypothetical protein